MSQLRLSLPVKTTIQTIDFSPTNITGAIPTESSLHSIRYHKVYNCCKAAVAPVCIAAPTIKKYLDYSLSDLYPWVLVSRRREAFKSRIKGPAVPPEEALSLGRNIAYEEGKIMDDWCGGGGVAIRCRVRQEKTLALRRLSRRSSSVGCGSLLARRSSVGLWHITCQDPNRLIGEINCELAGFRDLLIHVGSSRDCPELREKIRKLRRNCMDACKHTVQLLLPQIRSAVAEGIPADHPHLVLLFYMCQLFLRELSKCSRLVQLIPMDMAGYFENRAGPSNLGNVISQILLCKTIAPDFNQEEINSITKDSQELLRLLNEMQEFLPPQDSSAEKPSALISEDGSNKWTRKRRRNSVYKNLTTLCCMRRHNYL